MLPLSVYGAVVMAHSDVSDEYSSPNQFFFYRYDKSFVSSIWHYVIFFFATSDIMSLSDSLICLALLK